MSRCPPFFFRKSIDIDEKKNLSKINRRNFSENSLDEIRSKREQEKMQLIEEIRQESSFYSTNQLKRVEEVRQLVIAIENETTSSVNLKMARESEKKMLLDQIKKENEEKICSIQQTKKFEDDNNNNNNDKNDSSNNNNNNTALSEKKNIVLLKNTPQSAFSLVNRNTLPSHSAFIAVSTSPSNISPQSSDSIPEFESESSSDSGLVTFQTPTMSLISKISFIITFLENQESFIDELCRNNSCCLEYLCELDTFFENPTKIAKSIAMILEFHNKSAQSINKMLEMEFSANLKSNIVLRENTSFSLILSQFLEFYGKNWLCDLLTEEIIPILQRKKFLQNKSYTVSDPKGVANLQNFVSLILASATVRALEIPRKKKIFLEKLFAKQESLLESMLAEIDYITYFYFLRFFCPVLCQPKSFGFQGKLSIECQQVLITVSKVILLIVQNVQPEKDSPYFPFADFIKAKNPVVKSIMQTFLRANESRKNNVLAIEITDEQRSSSYELIKAECHKVHLKLLKK